MAERLYSLEIQGRTKQWGIPVYAEPEWVEDWRADGLEVSEVLNRIPEWMPSWAIKPFCRLQDLWNFKNPWSKT